MTRSMRTLLICIVFLFQGYCDAGNLYAYYTRAQKAGIVSLNPQTGLSTEVCDLSTLPALAGASSSSVPGTNNLLLMYSINALGNITLLQLDPSTCQSKQVMMNGIANGQNLVRDIKYNAFTQKLYMVLPNPFCMHGSLDEVDPISGSVVQHLANVVDPEGLNEQSGVASHNNGYYYISIPLGSEDTINYVLNRVDLSTGNSTVLTIANNVLQLGNSWSTNFTLNVYETASSSSPVVFGAISPPDATIKNCFPSGFYTLDSQSGVVTCVAGPVSASVYPLAEFNSDDQLLYQIMNDDKGDFYIYTYDAENRVVVSQAPCSICSELSILSYLP